MLAHSGMLRASADKTNRPHDLTALVTATVDPLLDAGAELLAFADAAVLRDEHEIEVARNELLAAAGSEGVVRAAAVAGNFEMMNRLLDAIGVRVSRHGMALAEQLGLEVPGHLRPT